MLGRSPGAPASPLAPILAFDEFFDEVIPYVTNEIALPVIGGHGGPDLR